MALTVSAYDVPSKGIISFGASTPVNGTRYLLPFGSGAGASLSVLRLRIPFPMRLFNMKYTNSTAGTGTGNYSFTLCKISVDTPTTTALTMSPLVTVRNAVLAAVVDLVEDDEIAVQTTANGTISLAPANIQIAFGYYA